MEQAVQGLGVGRYLKPKGGRPPHSTLAEFVKSLPEPGKLLGLTHITSSYVIRDVLADGAIQATEKCNVLDEEVTYTFYGRAAFREKSFFEPTDLPCMFPSVLIIDPTTVPRPKYVFCFDSGAFMAGMMDQYLHPYMPLFDFLLAPDTISAGRLINAAFETSVNYLKNLPTTSFTVPISNFEADCYRRIVLGIGSSKLDDRASTPELVFSDPIKLRESVRAAVIPDSLASDPNIGGALRACGVRIYEYPWTSGSRPIEIHFTVRALVEAAYRDLKWL